MKTLKQHWGKIAIAVLILLALYYYKVYKPKQEAKKVGGANGGAGGSSVDPEAGGDLVTLEPENGSNTDPGIDLGGGAESSTIGGGDMSTEPVYMEAPILNGKGEIIGGGYSSSRGMENGKPCAVGHVWNDGVCVLKTATATSIF